MPDTLEITRTDAEEVVFRGRHAYKVSVTAESTIDGLGSKIWVMHAGAGANESTIFSCVASLPQMLELPEDAPGLEADPGYPFYRVDTVEFAAYDFEELNLLWGKLVEDAQDLVDNFRLAGEYNNTITETLS